MRDPNAVSTCMSHEHTLCNMSSNSNEYELVRATLSEHTVHYILDEGKSKHDDLAQQNGFGPTFFHMMLRLP
jgi:hypothetical protein